MLTSIQSFGYSDVAKQMINRPSTLFQGASTTKAFTATAVALLVEDNVKYPHVQWNTRVCDLIPEHFAVADNDTTREVTIEDLLSHRTGIPRHDNSLAIEYDDTKDSPASYFQTLKMLPVALPLKDKFHYSSINYIVISLLIQELTGDRIEDFLRKTIWGKLNMRNTSFGRAIGPDRPAEIAKGYAWSRSGQRFDALPRCDYSNRQGSAAIVSNVLDYAKWIHWVIHQSAPLSRQGHQALLEPRVSKTFPLWSGAKKQSYAMGWSTLDYWEEPIIFHNGLLPGFSSLAMCSVLRKWGVVAFSNASLTGLEVCNKVAVSLLDEIRGIDAQDRFDWDLHLLQRLQPEDQGLQTEKLLLAIPTARATTSAELRNYVGSYTHAAYGTYDVVIRDGLLFINALARHYRCVF
jgi:CubicO group peptidase (beta-lactamase class C family)